MGPKWVTYQWATSATPIAATSTIGMLSRRIQSEGADAGRVKSTVAAKRRARPQCSGEVDLAASASAATPHSALESATFDMRGAQSARRYARATENVCSGSTR